MESNSSEEQSVSTEESIDDGNWSLDDSLIPRAVKSELPFPATKKCENYTDSILAWVQSQVHSYDISITGTQSFALGIPFLALVHKLDPSALNYEKFDKSNPIKTLNTVFEIAESALGIPNLLDPKEVAENRDPRALLLYLSLFQFKYRELEKSISFPVQQNVNKLHNLVTECVDAVSQMNEKFNRDCAVLTSFEGDSKNVHDERVYFGNRAKLMEGMIEEAIAMVDSLDQRNDLLAEENLLLQEQVNILNTTLDQEKTQRQRFEDLLKVETTIKAIGSELDEEGYDVEYYIKKFSDPKSLEQSGRKASADPSTETKNEPQKSEKIDGKVEPKPEPKHETKTEKHETKTEKIDGKVEPKPEPKHETKTEKHETKTEAKLEAKAETKTEAKIGEDSIVI